MQLPVCAVITPHTRAKYDELRAKERELTAFMDAFPQRRAAKQQEMQAKQDTIVALLAHIKEMQEGGGGGGGGVAQGAGAAAAAGDSSAPPGGGGGAMQSARVSLSAAAAAALAGAGGAASSQGAELAGKRTELLKLEELETKITVELAALREQLSGLQAEVDTYSDVEGARRAKEVTRGELEAQQQDLQTRQDTLQVRVFVSGLQAVVVMLSCGEGGAQSSSLQLVSRPRLCTT